jgi:hypothetical protein
VIADLDIWRVANLLIKRRGDGAKMTTAASGQDTSCRAAERGAKESGLPPITKFSIEGDIADAERN